MNINKVSNSPFKGMLKVQAPIRIFEKNGDEIDTKKELYKFRDDNRFTKLLGGTYTDEHRNGIPYESILYTNPGSNFPLAGYFEIDTDRVTEITPSEIRLQSRDGKYYASVLYNAQNPQRALWALNAYNTAAQSNVSVSINA